MNDKIQILQYYQSKSFPSSYIKDQNQDNDFLFDSFRIAEPIKEKIKSKAKKVITTERGKHISGLIDEIREGDAVEFDLKEGKKGLNAVNVKVV